MDTRHLTRAELAARTGISKPTIFESVRRLTEAGLLADTGEHSTGRGRTGTYYALADTIGSAVVISIASRGRRGGGGRRPRQVRRGSAGIAGEIAHVLTQARTGGRGTSQMSSPSWGCGSRPRPPWIPPSS